MSIVDINLSGEIDFTGNNNNSFYFFGKEFVMATINRE